jgi:hypothetical protein
VSDSEAQSRGFQLVPAWWPVLTALLAAIFSAGATYSTIGIRFTALENRVQMIETDRKDSLREWNAWRASTDGRVIAVELGVREMSRTLDRVADKLGVVH